MGFLSSFLRGLLGGKPLTIGTAVEVGASYAFSPIATKEALEDRVKDPIAGQMSTLAVDVQDVFSSLRRRASEAILQSGLPTPAQAIIYERVDRELSNAETRARELVEATSTRLQEWQF